MIDDPVLERDLTALFAESAPSRPPEHLLGDIVSKASRRRHRPRWLALIKEPPMRISSRVAVGSPTARLGAILTATLLLTVLGAGAVVAGAAYLSGPGPLVVDPNDPKAFQTITEAVAAAADGDTVLVRPGLYHESITIAKDITLDGDGDTPDDVVIEVDTDSPTYTYWYGVGPYGIVIEESDATVRDLTVRLLVGATGFTAKGGTVEIDNVVAEHELQAENNGGSVYLHGDVVATVHGSAFDGWLFVEEQSNATIERNDVGRTIVNNGVAAAGTIRGNRAWGVYLESGDFLIEDNHFEGPGDLVAEWRGINIGDGGVEGWTVRANTVVGNPLGIRVGAGSTGTIEGNTVLDNVTGIVIEASGPILTDNTVRGGEVGIELGGGSAALTGNTVEGAGTGLLVGTNATPTLVDNVICGNETNLVVAEGADPPATEGNEICSDAPPAGTG